MFDEVDEGMAAYKVTDKSPLGKHFVNYEGMGSDWYLKLTGAATQMIRGDAPAFGGDSGKDSVSEGLMDGATNSDISVGARIEDILVSQSPDR